MTSSLKALWCSARARVRARVQLLDVKFMLAWENSQHFTTRPTVSPRNDVRSKTAEIPCWWRVTFQIWVVILISWKKKNNQSEALPDLGTYTSTVLNFCFASSDVGLNLCLPSSELQGFVIPGASVLLLWISGMLAFILVWRHFSAVGGMKG